MQNVRVCGVSLANISRRRAETITRKMLACQKHRPPYVIYTPNAKIITQAAESPQYRLILNSASLNLADGNGARLLALAGGSCIRERIAGVDFGLHLASLCADMRLRLYLLGGMPGIAKKAGRELKKQFPKLNICGYRNGYFEKNGKENEAVLQDIRKKRTDVLFVCLGSPLQEQWIYENRSKLSAVRLCIALGGSLDIYAKAKKRAPEIWRHCSAEWLYRILSEPQRIPGFLKTTRAFFPLLRQEYIARNRQGARQSCR